MKEIIINFNDENKRLDNFLLKFFPSLSRTKLFQLIRTNKIKVNDKKVEHNYRLQLKDVIKVYYNFDQTQNETEFNFLQSKRKLDVIYEDQNILIINKPIGIQSQPSTSQFKENIQDMLLKYLYDKKQFTPENENTFIPSICNRLDTNTAGLLIAAKNAKSINEVTNLIKQHNITKKYKCLVIGDIKPNEATLTAYLKKDEQKNLVNIQSIQKPGYKEIITKYKKISFDGKYSLLEVELVTGRTHQIRAHFAFIGYPLVGETKYKQKNTNTDTRYKNQALVSYLLKFNEIDKQNYLSYLSNKTFSIKDI